MAEPCCPSWCKRDLFRSMAVKKCEFCCVFGRFRDIFVGVNARSHWVTTQHKALLKLTSKAVNTRKTNCNINIKWSSLTSVSEWWLVLAEKVYFAKNCNGNTSITTCSASECPSPSGYLFSDEDHAPSTSSVTRFTQVMVGEYETPPRASYYPDHTLPLAPPPSHSDSDFQL